MGLAVGEGGGGMKIYQLQVFVKEFYTAWLEVVSLDKETVTVVSPLKTDETITLTRDGTEVFKRVEEK